jgi:hypothetical protein
MNHNIALPALLALLLALTSPVYAAEALPGVKPPAPLVAPPAPEPEPVEGDAATNEKQPVRVGDWDVRISGSVILDIGSGNLPLPHK